MVGPLDEEPLFSRWAEQSAPTCAQCQRPKLSRAGTAPLRYVEKFPWKARCGRQQKAGQKRGHPQKLHANWQYAPRTLERAALLTSLVRFESDHDANVQSAVCIRTPSEMGGWMKGAWRKKSRL